MKAVQINSYGGTEVLEVNESVPKPTLKPGQVLVEVHAASLNPIDWKTRVGFLKAFAPLQFPATLGGDFAGVVMEVGPSADGFKIGPPASFNAKHLRAGDEVYGSAIIFNGGTGAFAELTASNAANAAQKPKSVDFIQAAALPLVGTSAIQALEDTIKLQSQQKILIHGGAGGIGHIAVQLAKALGAYVATTVSGDDKAFVKSLGADEIIDYKKQKFEEILKDFDAVFDMVGGETTDKSFKVLKKSGVLVSMAGKPNEELAKKYGVTAIGQNTVTNTKLLEHLAELVDSGKIKVHVDKVFPLESVKEAFTYQEQSHPRGKVVINVKE